MADTRPLVTAPQLLFAVRKLYPSLENMKDYWVGQPTDGLGGPQVEDARLYNWKSSIEEPDQDTIINEAIKLLPDFEAYQTDLETQKVFKSSVIKDRFTSNELLSIKQKSMTDANIGLIYDNLTSGSPIDVTSSDFQSQLDTLVKNNLLVESRKTDISKTVRNKWF